MKKLMLIAIVGMFALTAFAAPPSGGGRGPSGGPRGGGRGPAPSRVEPRHHDGPSNDLAKAGAIVGIVRDSLGILGIGSPRVVAPPPPPRVVAPAPVIIRQPEPIIRYTTPARREVIVTPPVVQEVVVEKPVVVEKVVETPVVQEVVVEKVVNKIPEIKNVEPIILNEKIYYKVTFSNGTVKVIKAE